MKMKEMIKVGEEWSWRKLCRREKDEEEKERRRTIRIKGRRREREENKSEGMEGIYKERRKI